MSKAFDLKLPFHMVAEMVDTHAANHGDRPSITCKGRTLTYGDVRDRSARAARWMKAMGLKKGDRVAQLGKASHAFFDFYFGAARVGISFVSLNFRLSPAEIAYQIGDCAAALIIYDGEFEALLADVPTDAASRLQLDSDSYETDLLAHDPDFTVQADTNSELMMMYTSGTTGKAKGVAVTHYSVMATRSADGQMGDWSIYRQGSPFMVATPLFHIAGVGWAIIGFCNMQHIFLEPDFVPDKILASLVENRIERVLFVPVMLVFFLQILAKSDMTFPDLKLIAYGASPITLPVLQAAMARFGCDFLQIYGMTETNGTATYMPPEDHRDPNNPRLTGAGKAFPFSEISIRDDNGKPLLAGETGEVWIKTASLMIGYLNRPEATSDVIEDGWYKSGDGGFLDEDGYLFVRDRIKDMIISGGENIYPSEVESAVMATGLVADCAIFSVPDDTWGEVVVLAAVPRTDFDLDAMKAALDGKLASYKCPRKLMTMEALPRNQSGKILRTALREMATGRVDLGA